MKTNYKHLLFLAFMLMGFLVGCGDGAVSSASSVQPTSQYDYTTILNGDLSNFAGNWRNRENEEITLKADGTTGQDYIENGIIIYNEKAGGFEKRENGAFFWTVILENYDGPSGYGVYLFPVGVEIQVDGEIVETDTTKVRLYAGHAFYDASEMSDKVFYID